MSKALPAPSFAMLVDQVATLALVQLGAIPDLISGETRVALDRARLSLGLLELLEKRTEGNLREDERRHLESRLSEIRSRLDAVSSGASAAPEPPRDEA